MLILPAAAARQVARSTRSYLILTLIFGLFSGLLGLWFSFLNSFAATGPMIVLIAGILFFATFTLRDSKQ
jgi:ABC-type Mn2+/Zn2+ transport system permease subunit